MNVGEGVNVAEAVNVGEDVRLREPVGELLLVTETEGETLRVTVAEGDTAAVGDSVAVRDEDAVTVLVAVNDDVTVRDGDGDTDCDADTVTVGVAEAVDDADTTTAPPLDDTVPDLVGDTVGVFEYDAPTERLGDTDGVGKVITAAGGAVRSVVLPVPSVPYCASPQHFTVAAFVITHTVFQVQLTAVATTPVPRLMSVAPGEFLAEVPPVPSCPLSLQPQQRTVPAPSSAHVWQYPAAALTHAHTRTHARTPNSTKHEMNE